MHGLVVGFLLEFLWVGFRLRSEALALFAHLLGFQFLAVGLDSQFVRALVLVSGLAATAGSGVCSTLSSWALGLLNWMASVSGLAVELGLVWGLVQASVQVEVPD
jgi:hypothetical protein